MFAFDMMLFIIAVVIAGVFSSIADATSPHDIVDTEDKYLVVLKPDVDLVKHVTRIRGVHVDKGYGGGFAGPGDNYTIEMFKAYSGHFHTAFVDYLERHNDVAYVE